jgi:hypothetical protein
MLWDISFSVTICLHASLRGLIVGGETDKAEIRAAEWNL